MRELHVTGTDAYGNPKREVWSDEPVIIWRACSTQCGPLHCAVEPRTLAMCPMHTRCRIVRVRNIAAEIETARMLNNGAPRARITHFEIYDNEIRGPFTEDIK